MSAGHQGPATAGRILSAAEAAARDWDVMIVGAGMGGCAAAYALSARSLQVLVLEKGRDELNGQKRIARDAAERSERLAAGRWPTQLAGSMNGRQRRFWAPLGCGVGGSTRLYAAALDRFRPSDFAPRTLPDGRRIGWPFDYAELAPYYEQAEARLQVHGTAGALEPAPGRSLLPPPEMSARDAWLFRRFEAAGLHPYRQHCGVRYLPGCTNCLANVCERDCKQHAGNAFLEPAAARGQVWVCPESPVLRLEAGKDRVEAARVATASGEVVIPARNVVLAAGAYFTPVLLLNSANPHWPEGLANGSGQVGRNLMFHFDRRLAIWSRRGLSARGIGKAIAVRDFYEDSSGVKFGELQSTGGDARYDYVLYALRQRFDLSRLASVTPLRHLLRIPALLADRLLGGAAIFAVILEDHPYPENRVRADAAAPSGMRFDYTIPGELLERARRLEAWLGSALQGLRYMWLSPGIEPNFGHPCGTCRAGTDPATSVVDEEGRAHGLSNLYIACASVFPTSGGTNPSLTIAAFGLRLGERLAMRLDGGARAGAGVAPPVPSPDRDEAALDPEPVAMMLREPDADHKL